MGAANMESGVNFFVGVVPIEGVFHFVTVMPLLTVGFDRRDFEVVVGEEIWGDSFLTEGFGDEKALLS